MIYKFARHDVPPYNLESRYFALHSKLERGEKLNRAEKNDVVDQLLTNSYSRVGIPIGGWMIDMRKWLTRFWVKVKNYGIVEVYAFDRTSIRKHYGRHNVVEIIAA